MSLAKELSGVAKISMSLESEEGYTPKTILLTGGAGFIGSHVVTRLVAKYPQYKVCR
jgi:FlaA1/EpsC-like NDP-sugar epimerase